MIGEMLQHYRIEAKLGAGGMGVVYRAFDTRLDRPVAIKVLPHSALANPDRKRRFVREAKTASGLNHPNIITIYDIGVAGSEDSPIDFIAMEYVAGKTLDRLVGRKGLKLPEALKYAVQIADALAAAHAAGIVHRDLKPANVMVNDQGLVKVLDFGLAKLTESPEPDPFAATQSMKRSELHLTEEGTIVGTVAYMSPEQAEGKRMDARSDIFSFGSLLYEMVTGRRAFSGDTKLSFLTAILHKEPIPLGQALEGAPYDLERIILRCLKKDPQRRWQTAADLKVGLEELLDEAESNRLMLPPAAGGKTGKRWRIWLLPTLAALVWGLIGGAFLGRESIDTEPPSFQRVTFRRGDVTAASFTPDGNIIYSAAWDGDASHVFSTRPGSRESRSLGLPPGKILAVTRSGDMAVLLGSFSSQYATGTLARAPLAGGAPREILEHVTDADFGPDGTSLAVVRSVEGRNRLEFPAGKVLYENEGRPPYSPSISPKGDFIAFFDFDSEIGDYAVALVDLASKRRVLSRGWKAVAGLGWSPRGDEIWFSALSTGGDPALRAVSLAGRERMIAQLPGWSVLHDIDRDGQVLLAAVDSRVRIMGLLPGDVAERDLSWLDTSYVYELSPDARLLLFLELSYGQGRNTAIYLRKTDGSQAVRLGDGNRPALSPDGKWVLCIRRDPGRSELILLPTGAGEARNLTTAGMRYESGEWFPDGRRILFTGNEPGRPTRTYVQDLAGGNTTAVTAEGVRGSRVSPDGKFVVITQSGASFLQPLQGGTPRPLSGIEPADALVRWSADGRFLFLRRSETGGTSAQIYRVEVATGRRELWRQVKPPDPIDRMLATLSITPDGKSYAYSFQRDLANLYLVTGLK